MKLYENVVIGNFLYSLGFSVCAKSKGTINPVSVNLLQQTPVDRTLGDVLIQSPGTLRLIEFKQTTNKSKKEIDKQQFLLDSIKGDFQLMQVSRSIHWFLETGIKGELNMMVTKAVPYLDAFSGVETRYDFNGFVQSIASEAVRPQPLFSEELLKSYLQLVANINGGDTSGSGGMILHLDKNGSIKFCELQDLMQLRLLDREYQKQIKIHYESNRSLENEMTHSKQRSRDMDMEL